MPLVDRTVVHGRNNVPWKQEREDYIECDYQYINMMQHRKLNDIIDVNNGEKEFFTLWNSFLTSLPGVQGGLGFRSTPGPGVVRQFIRLRGTEILRKNLYRNLEIHLTVLREEGVLDTGELVQMIEEIQMVAAKQQLLGDIITNWEKQTQSESVPFPRPSGSTVSLSQQELFGTNKKKDGDLVPVTIERKIKDKKSGDEMDIKGRNQINRRVANKERQDKDDDSNIDSKFTQNNYERQLSSRCDRDLQEPKTSTPSSKTPKMFSPNASPILFSSKSVTSPISSKMTPSRSRQAIKSPIISVNKETSAAPKTIGLNHPSSTACGQKNTQRNVTLCAKKKENGRRNSEDTESRGNQSRDLRSSLTARSVDLVQKRRKSP